VNIDTVDLLDLNHPMAYFWNYRVRDKRPLEVSPGVVSQSERNLGSEPAGKGIPPKPEIHPEPGIDQETVFPGLFNLKDPFLVDL
jgi:hypothetical protein